MLEDEKAAPIFAGARACHIAFEQCLQSASHPILGVRQYSAIEDQMARFSIWTTNMAVFAAWKSSLDYRLREADDVQRLMIGMLEVLKGRISECATFISNLPDTQGQNFQVSSMQVHADFERMTTALASQVGLFHEVSNVIRKASRQTQNEIAASSFRIRDQEGNDLENVLQGFLDRNLGDRFPESNSILRERLASTMVLRRKRILYRRARYPTTLIKPQQTAPKPVITPTNPSGATSHDHSIVKSATTLDADNFRRAYSPSAVSSASYISVGASQDWVFPSPPPTPEDPSVEVTCPYCLYVLPGHEFQNEARWRKHVLADLDPLVCLFDHCDEPQVLYSHRKDWLQHMRKHTERWHCNAKSHGLQKFETFEKFLLHMKDDHKKSYNDSQIELLAERGIQSNRQLFEVCPLCGITEEHDSATQGSMIRHIMSHLRSLALRSLPPLYLEDDDAVPDDEDNSQQIRSTINNFASHDDGRSSFDLLFEPESPSLDAVTRDEPHTSEFRNSPIEDVLQAQATMSEPLKDRALFALSEPESNAGASLSEYPPLQLQQPDLNIPYRFRLKRNTWEFYKDKIKELYAKHPLKTVREIMLREEGVDAPASVFREKLDEWGMTNHEQRERSPRNSPVEESAWTGGTTQQNPWNSFPYDQLIYNDPDPMANTGDLASTQPSYYNTPVSPQTSSYNPLLMTSNYGHQSTMDSSSIGQDQGYSTYENYLPDWPIPLANITGGPWLAPGEHEVEPSDVYEEQASYQDVNERSPTPGDE